MVNWRTYGSLNDKIMEIMQVSVYIFMLYYIRNKFDQLYQ